MKKREYITLAVVFFVILLTFLINRNKKDFSESINRYFFTLNPLDQKSLEDALITVTADKNQYFRFENPAFRVQVKKNHNLLKKNSHVAELRVFYNNRIVETIGGIKFVVLKKKRRYYFGHWPVPWNARVGTYVVEAKIVGSALGNQFRNKTYFQIINRQPPKISSGVNALVLEAPATSAVIPGPAGQKPHYHNNAAWARYIGANTFLILGGQTNTWQSSRRKRVPWDSGTLKASQLFGKTVKSAGLKYGVWIMSYRVEYAANVKNRGYQLQKLGYDSSWMYAPKIQTFIPSKHVSLDCEKRIQDIIQLVRILSKDDNIDYIGLDYIRAHGGDGYEMVDDFVVKMNIPVPENWQRLSQLAKMMYMKNRVYAKPEGNQDQEKWRWFQAHKTASIVNRIIKESGSKKKFWVFTLAWQHGKQHGQDPYMMNDAGVYFDAVMLYQANKPQFESLIDHWYDYLPAEGVNIVVGQTIDRYYLDNPSLTFPEEFRRRLIKAYKKINYGDTANGIFIHDTSRAFIRGNRGGFTPLEWMYSAGACVSACRNLQGQAKVAVKIERVLASAPGRYQVDISIENISKDDVFEVRVASLSTPGVNPVQMIIPLLPSGRDKTVRLQVPIAAVRYRTMLVIQASYGLENYFDFRIIR